MKTKQEKPNPAIIARAGDGSATAVKVAAAIPWEVPAGTPIIESGIKFYWCAGVDRANNKRAQEQNKLPLWYQQVFYCPTCRRYHHHGMNKESQQIDGRASTCPLYRQYILSINDQDYKKLLEYGFTPEAPMGKRYPVECRKAYKAETKKANN